MLIFDNQSEKALNYIPLLWITLFLGLTSCSVGPAYCPPPIEVPTEWKNKPSSKANEENKASDATCSDCDEWWRVFQDEKLAELEAIALANNRDLFIAWERIQEARALAGVAAADFYPQITTNPSFTNTNELTKTYVPVGKNSSSSNGMNSCKNAANATTSSIVSDVKNPFREHVVQYFWPINLNYEVDLWGKIQDRYDAAAYNWQASKKDYETVMLSLTANLATAYYQIRTTDRQIDLLLQVIQTMQKALDINQARYEEGLANYADVALATEQLDTTINQCLEVKRQRQVLENQIALLLGIPASVFCLEHLPLEDLPPAIPAGIPSEVILRRPDIATAESTVLAEHAQVKEAYSLFFPSLNLTAATGFESPSLKYFLSVLGRYWMDGLQINQMIFDGGRTASNLHVQISHFQQASGTYQQQVLIALQEVENALADLHSYAEQYRAAQAAAEWAKKTYGLYSDRYTSGIIYYIDVATTQRAWLNDQITANSIQGLRYISTIQLIKALGGSW